MPAPSSKNLTTLTNLQNDLVRQVVVVWILNIVPGLGLGFLYAARMKGLVLMFFIWVVEMAWLKTSMFVPLYFALSVLGTIFVIKDKYKPALSAVLSDPDSTVGSRNSDADAANPPGSIGSDLRKDSSEFALRSFDRKLQSAELQLARSRSSAESAQEDDPSADSDRWEPAPDETESNDPAGRHAGASAGAAAKATTPLAGTNSDSASEADAFGSDPFPSSDTAAAYGRAATPSYGGSANGDPQTAPPDKPLAGASAAAAAVVLPEYATDYVASGLDPVIFQNTAALLGAAEQSSFDAVRADSIGDAARAADQITARFAAENATAAAGLLDSAAQADAGNLIQPDPTLQFGDGSAARSGNVSSDLPTSNLGLVSGLGEIHPLGVHGYESSLGVVPDGLPSLSGDAPPESKAGQNPDSEVATASGAPAAQSAKCPKCGAALQGQFSFCLSCLAPL